MGIKGRAATQEQEKSACRAAANQTTGNHSTAGLVDNRGTTATQRKLIQGMADSPQAVAQRKAQENADAGTQPLQRVSEEEEEPLQGKFTTAQLASLEEEEPLQGKFDTAQRVSEEEEPLQGKFEAVPPANKTGMPDNLKSGIESLSGMDMSEVRVHHHSSKPAQLFAHAYAQGNDIHLSSGQEKHLPHEAWHVVQQRQGRVRPTMQMAGTQINDDVSLEREADVMGAKAASVGQQVAQQAGRSGGEAGHISTVQRQGVVQRKVLTDMSEIETRMGTFSVSDPAKEGDTASTYVARFKLWLAKSNDSLDGNSEQSLLARVNIVKSAAAVAAVLSIGGNKPPTDSEVGNMRSWVMTNYTIDVLFRSFEFLTDKASQDIAAIKGIKSDLAKGDYDLWLLFDERLGSSPIKAWPLYLENLRSRKTLLSKESKTLIQQMLHGAMSDKVNALGGNIVGAMGQANIRSGVPANDQFQYPRVPYKQQGMLGGGGGYLDPAYWKKIKYSSFILKDGSVKPSMAVKAAFAGPTRLECLSTTRAVLAKSLLDTFGDEVFDHHFKYKSDNDPGVVIGTNTDPVDRVAALMHTPQADKVDDLLPGDWIYYKNDARYLQKHPAGLWQGENCVYDGNRKWSGFGLNGMTEQQLKTSMNRAFNADPDERDIQRDPQLGSTHPQRKEIATKKDAVPIGWLWTSLERFHLNKFLV